MSVDGGPSAGASRPSMANRADPLDQAAVGKISKLDVPLTADAGVKLRPEAIDYDVDGNTGRPWGEVVEAFREWYEERLDAGLVYEKEGEQFTGPQENRFQPQYSDRLYAKLKDLERGVREAYGRRLHTGLLTFTASAGRPGEWVPPVDQMEAILGRPGTEAGDPGHGLGSWEAIRRALARVLDGHRWEYLAVLEPHESGYMHVHIAVFVDGETDPETFRPVIDAHLRNCHLAGAEAHEYENVITVKRVARDKDFEQLLEEAGYDPADRDATDRDLGEIGNLSSYLGEYLGIYGGDPLDAPGHVQAFNALLWATGRQRWRPSNGAQEFMAYTPPEKPAEWELIGVTYDGGETIDAVNPEGGGVNWVRTSWVDRPPP